MEHHHRYRTALVLQGGSALGAYEYGVLKALYEFRPQFKPAVVTGISIGAINAAVLVGAKKDPIRTLEHVWRNKFTVPQPLPPPLNSVYEHLIPPEAQKYLALLGNCGIYQVRPDYLYAPFLATSVYDLAPLRETLAEVVDVRKLNQSQETRVAVCAANVATGELTTFDNREGLSLDHIVASASFPPSYPMTAIDGQYYWDGGLVVNTPLSAAINLLEEHKAEDPGVSLELIVVELFPMRAEVPRDLVEVLNRSAQFYFTSKLTLDKKLFAKFNGFIELIAALDQALPPNSPIRGMEGYQELRRHKKIDAFTIITFQADPELALPGDYSPATIEARIEAGYRDAVHKRIWEPTLVPSGVSSGYLPGASSTQPSPVPSGVPHQRAKSN